MERGEEIGGSQLLPIARTSMIWEDSEKKGTCIEITKLQNGRDPRDRWRNGELERRKGVD
jgi:hypothetical protein